MSRLKTLIIMMWMAVPAQAASNDLLTQVAQCTGRMSAEMEFAWLMGESGEQARLYRSHLEDVLQALAHEDDGRRVLSLRIEAKHAHATLLTRSVFNDNSRDAARAAQMAARFSGACRAILTG